MSRANFSYQSHRAAQIAGFTIIEMMISIAVLAILAGLAVPSFIEFREKSVVRGAIEEALTLVSNARFEAIKRNLPVHVTIQRTSTTLWCMGASTQAANVMTGTAPVACDCFEEDVTSGAYCNVTQFPPLDPAAGAGDAQATRQLKGARMTTDPASFFGGDGFTFDPKLGTIIGLEQGGVGLASPSTSYNFQLNLVINPLGRGRNCVPFAARAIAGYLPCAGI